MPTDESDPPDERPLEERVGELEQTVQRMMPSRRQALRTGGSLGIGALLGVGAANSVSAGSSQSGKVGTSANPVDVEAEDVTLAGAGGLTDPAGNTITDFVGTNLALSGGAVGVNQEGIEDIVGGMAGANLTYDDANDTLDAAGGGIWTEDGNSPFTASASNSISCSLSQTGEAYLIFVEATDNAGSGNNLDMTVDSDTTANYDHFNNAGTRTTGASNLPTVMFGSSNSTVRAQLKVTENDFGSYVNNLGVGGGSGQFRNGEYDGGPVSTSFDFQRGVSTDWTVEVYRRNVA